jgi:hypothetical protein
MEIGLSHLDKAAIRKEESFSDFPAMLQYALWHNGNKLSVTFKNPRLSCPSRLSLALIPASAQSDPFLSLQKPLFPA